MCDFTLVSLKESLVLVSLDQFTALPFIEETLKRDPYKKIVCLERGGTFRDTITLF